MSEDAEGFASTLDPDLRTAFLRDVMWVRNEAQAVRALASNYQRVQVSRSEQSYAYPPTPLRRLAADTLCAVHDLAEKLYVSASGGIAPSTAFDRAEAFHFEWVNRCDAFEKDADAREGKS